MNNKRKLNKGQLDVLKVVFKFRYATKQLVADSLSRPNNNAMHSRMTILLNGNYVQRRYSKQYKLAGRAAEYFLTPSGLRALQAESTFDGPDESILKQSYKDKSASDAFVLHNLAIFSIANRLISLYGLRFLTRRELTGFDYLLQPLPAGFISYKHGEETARFFVEVVSSEIPSFALERRLRNYVQYEESGAWDVTNSPFPALLVILDNKILLKRMPAVLGRVLTDSEVSIFYTGINSVLGSAEPTWTNSDNEEKLFVEIVRAV